MQRPARVSIRGEEAASAAGSVVTPRVVCFTFSLKPQGWSAGPRASCGAVIVWLPCFSVCSSWSPCWILSLRGEDSGPSSVPLSHQHFA